MVQTRTFTPGGNDPGHISDSSHHTPVHTLVRETLKGGLACGPPWIPAITPFFVLAGQNHCSQLLNNLLTCFPTSRVALSTLIHPTFCHCSSSNCVQTKHSEPSINLPNFTYLIKQISSLSLYTQYKWVLHMPQTFNTLYSIQLTLWSSSSQCIQWLLGYQYLDAP